MNIVVIGASRGIGKGVVLRFIEEYPDSNYLVTWRSSPERILRTKRELEREITGNLVINHVDVRNEREVETVLNSFVGLYGKVDILINNAGITRNARVKDMGSRDWQDVIDTNLTGMFNVLRAVIPHMRRGGSIVNTGSVTGFTGVYGAGGYAASKAGVHALTKSVAKEVARERIRVNAVAPGFIMTDLLEGLSGDIVDTIKGKTLLGRLGTIEEVAEFVVFLATKATYCTGQVYLIDGGYRE